MTNRQILCKRWFKIAGQIIFHFVTGLEARDGKQHSEEFFRRSGNTNA